VRAIAVERIESLPEALVAGRIGDGDRDVLAGDALARRVHALAGGLRAAACRTLAMQLDNGPDWIVADFACHVAGIRLLPLPTFFSAEQVRHALATAPCDAFLGDRREARLPDDVARGGPPLRIGSTWLQPLTPARTENVLPPGTGKVTFTSGSTGRPKGVCLGNGQLLRQARVLAEAAGLDRPRHLCVLPLSTLLENVAGVYAPLLAGGEVIAPPLASLGFDGSSSLDPVRFTAVIARHRPNSLILTPQLLQILIGAARAGWTPPDSLAFVAVGGAHVPPAAIEAAHALGIPAWEGYGLSECASVVALNRPGAARPGSCGRPLPHVRVTTVDGEIHVAGNAMLGYAGEPRSWGRDTIATGDLGALDADGFLRLAGRRSNLLISSYGRNISPEWVESELLADGRLAECVVFGDARPYCVALLRPRDPYGPDSAIQAVIDAANRRLPDYARVRAWRRLPESLARSPGLATDNGRPKRPAILARYGVLIETLYPAATNDEITEVLTA